MSFWFCSFGSSEVWRVLLYLWSEKEQKHIQLFSLIPGIIAQCAKIDQHIDHDQQQGVKNTTVHSKAESIGDLLERKPFGLWLWNDLDDQLAKYSQQQNK